MSNNQHGMINEEVGREEENAQRFNSEVTHLNVES